MPFHHNKNDTTCILLFSQSEIQESIAKPIADSKKQNVLMWQKIIDKKSQIISKTNLQVFISNEKNQVGFTFGQKLNHAINTVFEQNFEKIIIIGNDCLSLSKKDLLAAEALLQKKDFVLGKDFQGGAYLIGVSKDKFQSSNFENLPWQSKNLYQEIFTLFNRFELGLLVAKNDFNNKNQFKKSLNKLSFLSLLKKVLLTLLNKKIQFFIWINKTIELSNKSIIFNKGSPLLDYL
jgi:uncharacterized protein